MGNFPFVKKYIRLRYIYISLFILISTTSCQVQDQLATQYETMDMEQSIEDAFQGKDFVASSWIQDNWWEMFGDPQLNLLMEKMLECNPSLAIALERVYLAHDSVKQKLSPLLPSVDAQFQELFAGFSWNDKGIDPNNPLIPSNVVPKWINLLGYLLNFRWTIDLWGRDRNLYKAAIDETKMQMAEAAQVKLLLSIQLSQAYFDLQLSLNQKEIQLEILKNMDEKLFILEKVYENALTDEMALQNIEKDILNLKSKIIFTGESIEQSIHQIKALVGLSANDATPLENPMSSFGYSFPFPDQIPLNFLLRRPDIVAKIWKIEAQAKRIKSAKVAFLPTIDLGSFSGYLDLKWGDFIKPKGWFSSILPGATLPIFKGLQLKTNLQYSIRQYNLSIYDYNQMLLTAAKEVVNNIVSFRVSNEQLHQHEKIIEKDHNLLNLSSLRYEYGLNSYLDVLSTKITLLQDEINLREFNRLHLLAALNLIKSLGGGYECLEAVALNEEPKKL